MKESKKQSMIYRFKKITILGCGQIGLNTAIKMSDSGNIVTVIDKIPEKLTSLPEERIESRRIIPIIGDGTLESVLRGASTQDADVYIAATDDTSVNLMSSLVANYIFQVPEIASIVHHQGLEEFANKCGISIINPLSLMIEKLSDLNHNS